MAVQATLGIEFKQAGVNGAVDDQHIVEGVSSSLNAANGGTARIHDERNG